MTWVEVLPIITGVLYTAAGFGYAWRGEEGWAVAYFAYALANAGLVWAAIGGRAS